MQQHYSSFDRRMARHERRQRRIARKSEIVMRGDGLMVVRPRRGGFMRVVKFMVLGLVLFFGLKSAAYFIQGPITYETRRAALAEGTEVEAMVAHLMQVDPVTRAIIENAGPLVSRAEIWWAENRTALPFAEREL
ncbi:MAG: hypothetical protein AAF618_07085 [Pseudomonadota bacterium]